MLTEQTQTNGDQIHVMCLMWTGLSAGAQPEIMRLPSAERKTAAQQYYSDGKANLLAQLGREGFGINNVMEGSRYAIVEGTVAQWNNIRSTLNSLGVIAEPNQAIFQTLED